MTKAIEFTGKVEGGRLPRHVSERIAAAIRRAEGMYVTVAVSERKKRRTNGQNRYYWAGVVGPVTEMFRENGNMVDPDDVHTFLKEHVGRLKQVIVTPDGEVLRTLGSTAKLSTVEFSSYIEAVRAWAMEHNLTIASPDEFNQQEE